MATTISTNGNLAADCQPGTQDPNSTCLSYDSHDRLQTARLPNGGTITTTYNTAGQRASYTVTMTGTTTLQEVFTYRGTQVGQVAFTGASLTTPYTDTYLYRQDGAPSARWRPRPCIWYPKGCICQPHTTRAKPR